MTKFLSIYSSSITILKSTVSNSHKIIIIKNTYFYKSLLTLCISIDPKFISFLVSICCIYLASYFIVIIPCYYKIVIWKDFNLRMHSWTRRLALIIIYLKLISIFSSIFLKSLSINIIFSSCWITNSNYYESSISKYGNIWIHLMFICLWIGHQFLLKYFVELESISFS